MCGWYRTLLVCSQFERRILIIPLGTGCLSIMFVFDRTCDHQSIGVFCMRYANSLLVQSASWTKILCRRPQVDAQTGCKSRGALTSYAQTVTLWFNAFKYHVSCTDGKILVGIGITFFTVVLFNSCVLSCRPFVVITFSTGLVGCWSFFCLLTWAVDRRNFNTQQDLLKISW